MEYWLTAIAWLSTGASLPPFAPAFAGGAALGSGFLFAAALGSSSRLVPSKRSSASFLRSSRILFFSSSLL